MLQKLDIHNYAIIDRINIEFDPQLNCMTGETGAGKSIIMGALGLIMGRRADTKMLNKPDRKCFAEATFTNSTTLISDLLVKWDIDQDEDTILRREINIKGKTRAFINDTPVNLSQIREVCKRLISLHQQFDTMDIVDEENQIDLLDSFAGNNNLRLTYSKYYNEYSELKEQLNQAKKSLKKANLERDYKQFLLNELEEAQLDEIDFIDLENELERLQHVDDIRNGLSYAIHELELSENNIIDNIKGIKNKLSDFTDLNDGLKDIGNRLASTIIEVEDLMIEIHNQVQKAVSDPKRMEEVQEKMNSIFLLQKKHNVQNLEQLLLLKTELEDEIYNLDNLELTVNTLENEVTLHKNKLLDLSSKLHSKRLKSAKTFCADCVYLLQQLSMPHAKFEIIIEKQDIIKSNGQDLIAFNFSSNPGKAPQILRDVASGGEMSRLALCLKAIIGSKLNMPTLIFDEIDTGISGEVAIKMGEILRQLSESRQVVSITHSPQIAGQAKTHYSVYKEYIDDNTFTRIRKLETKDRIVELASMISGSPPSEVALKNAEELLKT